MRDWVVSEHENVPEERKLDLIVCVGRDLLACFCWLLHNPAQLFQHKLSSPRVTASKIEQNVGSVMLKVCCDEGVNRSNSNSSAC
jgi:hypothetical protein